MILSHTICFPALFTTKETIENTRTRGSITKFGKSNIPKHNKYPKTCMYTRSKKSQQKDKTESTGIEKLLKEKHFGTHVIERDPA